MKNLLKKSSLKKFQKVELKKEEATKVKGGTIIVEDYIAS